MPPPPIQEQRPAPLVAQEHVPTLLVAAAVMIDGGSVLLTQRKAGSHLAGTWEFPGGKVEPNEDPRDALVRELQEELGVNVSVGDIVEVTFHRYPERSVLLLFYTAALRPDSPPPSALDVADWRWVRPEEFSRLEFPPADLPVLSRVRMLVNRAGRSCAGV